MPTLTPASVTIAQFASETPFSSVFFLTASTSILIPTAVLNPVPVRSTETQPPPLASTHLLILLGLKRWGLQHSWSRRTYPGPSCGSSSCPRSYCTRRCRSRMPDIASRMGMGLGTTGQETNNHSSDVICRRLVQSMLDQRS